MPDKNANILRLFLLVLLFAALPYRAAGQGGYVNVTATVLDPNGVPYAGCHGSIDFVTPANATAQPTLYRGLFQKNFSISQCDSLGKFTLTLAATDQVDCGLGSLGCGQWHFSITSQDGKTGFQALLSIGPGNPNQTTNEDISTLLQAAAAPLPISSLSQFLSLNNNWTGANSFSKQITSTVATGTAPLSIASTTVVPNLNAQLHNGKTAPAGNIVGDSDTQNLSNKTFTGASNGNSVTLLCSSGPAAAITGNASAQTFFSCTIPANAVANLKGLRVTLVWSHSTGSAVVTYGLTLNGVACWPSNNTASTVGGLSQIANFIETGSTTGNVMTQQGFFSFTATSLTGLAWTSGQTLAATFSVANTDQVTPLFFLVELIQ